MKKKQELYTYRKKWIKDKVSWPFIKNHNKERTTSCLMWDNKTCPQRMANPQIEKCNLRCGTDCRYSREDILTTIQIVDKSGVIPAITFKISDPVSHHLEMRDSEQRVIFDVKFAKGYITIGQSNQPGY